MTALFPTTKLWFFISVLLFLVDSVSYAQEGKRQESQSRISGNTAPEKVVKMINAKISALAYGGLFKMKSCGFMPAYDFHEEKVSLPKGAIAKDFVGLAISFEDEWGSWGSEDILFRNGLVGVSKALPVYVRNGTEAKVSGKVYVYRGRRWYSKQ